MIQNTDQLNSTQSAKLASAWQQVSKELLDRRNAAGHWPGRLSSSALATATAISALAEFRNRSKSAEACSVKPREIDRMIELGCRWLLNNQNPDGGWGDSDESHSNVATSMLAVAAITLAGKSAERDFVNSVDQANDYIDGKGRVRALRERYGKDKTFAVPILANCAIAGLVEWNQVSALPFEASLVPQRFFRFINLPVVSYAIPALVAIGQLKHARDPSWNPVTRLLRMVAVQPGLKLLERMQPASGGYLEAIPLTCFVAMSLAHADRADHPVVRRCIQFVADSFRDEGQSGTWPIDTNLATWNTTLAVNALGSPFSSSAALQPTEQHLTSCLLDWVLGCQYKTVHPFTGSAPGGWGWSDLSGAVPDADDTPGAMLAIRKWYDLPTIAPEDKRRIKDAAMAGAKWLIDLQNRDRGWPTFCRGWGRLPFDRSGNDITAHVIRALTAWKDVVQLPGMDRAVNRGLDYLRRNANEDGSWLPLWFGNQDHAHEENPVYGTAKVLFAWHEAGMANDPAAIRAVNWLLAQQNEDSGWGGGQSYEMQSKNSSSAARRSANAATCSSLQESCLAVDALSRFANTENFRQNENLKNVLNSGLDWVLAAIGNGQHNEKWPIGFYFAKLWYYEELYPLLFCASTLRQLMDDQLSGNQKHGP